MENEDSVEFHKKKKELIKRLALTIMSGVLLLFFSFYTFGWFSFVKKVEQKNMGVTVSAADYDIIVERPTEYESGYRYITGTGEVKDKLAEKGYNFIQTNALSARDLAFEMVCEYVYETKKYFMPGAYGSLTFYIRPAEGKNDITANIAIDLGAYVSYYEGETQKIKEVDSSTLLNLLKGHILFFSGRTGADYEHFQYSGLVENGQFEYKTSEHEKCTEEGKTDLYKVVLYWEWIIIYDDLINKVSTEGEQKKYPSEVSGYLAEHPEYFFAVTQESDASDEALSDAYNDGDQIIGDGADCLVVYVTAK